MSYQAYLDNIKAKTGKTPSDFKKMAEKKGLLTPDTKAGPLVAWLKEEFALGHGHAMAVFHAMQTMNKPAAKPEEKLEQHFKDAKAVWRKPFGDLMKELEKEGEVSVAPASTYVSLLRNKKKFAIIQVTKDRMDIGIKLKDKEPTERFMSSGTWNAMVTHRVQLHDAAGRVDKEILCWLIEAYHKA